VLIYVGACIWLLEEFEVLTGVLRECVEEGGHLCFPQWFLGMF
jgi:hypothetical protein